MPRGGYRPGAGAKKKLRTMTSREEETVLVSLAFGAPEEEWARVYGVTVETFKSHFGDRIAQKKRSMIDRLANSAYAAAANGSVADRIFLLKTRGGFREVERVESGDAVQVHGGLPEPKKSV
jgi:hypothetical protein